MSAIRQNFHEETEAGLNKQINLELHASYIYQSISFYFDRADVSFPGFSKFFKHNSDEEREHAEKFMKYQNKRGGRIVYKDIQKPEKDEWGTPLEALEFMLALEKDVTQALYDLHKVAGNHGDAHLTDYLEEEFIDEQVETVNKIGAMIVRLKRAGPGLGEYIFDKEDKALEWIMSI